METIKQDACAFVPFFSLYEGPFPFLFLFISDQFYFTIKTQEIDFLEAFRDFESVIIVSDYYNLWIIIVYILGVNYFLQVTCSCLKCKLFYFG